MREQKKVIATAFALCGFALAVACGLLAGNPASVVLIRAMLVLLICRAVGEGAAACISFVLEDHLTTYVAARPIPDINVAEQAPLPDQPVVAPLGSNTDRSPVRESAPVGSRVASSQKNSEKS